MNDVILAVVPSAAGLIGVGIGAWLQARVTRATWAHQRRIDLRTERIVLYGRLITAAEAALSAAPTNTYLSDAS